MQPPPAPDDAALQALATANLVEAFRRVARLAPAGAIEEAAGLAQIATTIPRPTYNPTFLTRPVADPTALAARLRPFYERAGLPGALWATDPREAADAAAVARVAGLAPGVVMPALLLAPLPDPPAPPAGLEVRAVRDLATLRAYNDTLAAGYGWPRDWLAFFDTPEALRLPEVTYYLGLVDGAPAGIAMGLTSHRIAGVHFVATLPAYQRRGLATVLTWRIVADGRAQGCLASALQASAQGRPVYERMGYRHVADFQTWHIP